MPLTKPSTIPPPEFPEMRLLTRVLSIDQPEFCREPSVGDRHNSLTSTKAPAAESTFHVIDPDFPPH